MAVTAWSLLGALDWDHLVTQNNGHYESGEFNMIIPPRPTAMAKMISCLSTTGQFDHPVLQVPGWWKRSDRFIHGMSVDESGDVRAESFIEDSDLHAGELRPVLITGSSGALGQAFSILCKTRGIPYCQVPRSELDIANPVQVRRAFFEYRPGPSSTALNIRTSTKLRTIFNAVSEKTPKVPFFWRKPVPSTTFSF